MSANKDLTRWVSDQLHAVVGFSESSLSQYMVALASRASSQDDIVRELEANDIPLNDASRSFASELFRRVPRKGGQTREGAEARKRATNAQLLRQSEKYGLLVDEEEAAPVSAPAKGTRSGARERKRNVRRRKRRGSSSSSSDDEGSPTVKTRMEGGAADKKKKKTKKELEDELAEKYLEEHRKFIGTAEEGREYGRKLRAKDDASTKRTAPGGIMSGKEAEEVAQVAKASGPSGTGSEDAPEMDTDEARKISRQQYLNKREAQQLKLHEYLVAQEEQLFAGENLTAEERKTHEFNKKILDLAKKRSKGEDLDDAYMIPDGDVDDEGNAKPMDRDKVLGGRWAEEEKFVSEQDQWEQHQTATASMKFGAEDARNERGAEYDMVFEDQIEFISAEIQSGKEVDKQKEELPQDDLDRNDLDAVRKSLPIFPWREGLLAAISEHQVCHTVVGVPGCSCVHCSTTGAHTLSPGLRGAHTAAGAQGRTTVANVYIVPQPGRTTVARAQGRAHRRWGPGAHTLSPGPRGAHTVARAHDIATPWPWSCGLWLRKPPLSIASPTPKQWNSVLNTGTLKAVLLTLSPSLPLSLSPTLPLSIASVACSPPCLLVTRHPPCYWLYCYSGTCVASS